VTTLTRNVDVVCGVLAVCIREVQKSLLQSSKRLIEAKIQRLGVTSRRRSRCHRAGEAVGHSLGEWPEYRSCRNAKCGH
jgi:hypothetical protein